MVYTKVEFDDNGKLFLPPVGAKLSDELACLVVKAQISTERCKPRMRLSPRSRQGMPCLSSLGKTRGWTCGLEGRS